LIRGVLVPSFMRLAGSANWWAPRVVRKRAARPLHGGAHSVGARTPHPRAAPEESPAAAVTPGR
jgi:RND superfamily putative drug exporter